MKKTINISLGSQSFTIEEDAYDRLDIYLSEVRENFADYPEVDEIVSDIEARIAERFNSKLKNKVVDLNDVEELVAVMGQPEDFEEGAKTKKSSRKSKVEERSSVSNKKLFRNPDDVILAGVCSGIAAYFGIDTLWVRLAFFISIFFGGLGIVLYIIFWVLVPMAATETEKMQMRGESVNLKNLEATIRDRVKEFKKKDFSSVKSGFVAVPRKIASVIEWFGRLLKKVVLICFKIFGICIFIGGSMGILFAVFVLINVLFNDLFSLVSVFNPGLPLHELIDANAFTILAVSGFFTALAVFIVMNLIGVSLISSRNKFTYFSFFTLLGVWIIAVSTFVATAIGVAPKIHDAVNKIEATEFEEKTIELEEFSALEVEGNYVVEVYSAKDYEVKVEAPETWNVENVEVENGILMLDAWHGNLFNTENEDGNFRMCLFCENQPVKIKIYTPDLDSVSIERMSKLNMTGFDLDKLQVEVRNAAQMDLDINVEDLDVRTSEIARLNLKGNIANLKVYSIDMSEVNAVEAQIESAEVETRDLSNVYFDEEFEYQEVENVD